MPGRTYDPFDVVVVPFPFTDRPVTKRMPALVLSSQDFNREHAHMILTMITSAHHTPWTSDVVLVDWRAAGLTVPCRLRFKLFTLPKSNIHRHLGQLGQPDRQEVQAALMQGLAAV